MAISKDKTFKISQLEEISNLDDKDLFLVSDYEGGKCYTKKLTLKKFLTTIIPTVVNDPSLIEKILDDQGELDEKIDEKVNTKVEEAFDIQTIDGGNANGLNH